MAKQYLLRIVLDISAHDIQRYYEGAARDVSAIAADGRRIQFPANILRSVVSHDGVRGEFELNFSEDHKFIAIRRIS